MTNLNEPFNVRLFIKKLFKTREALIVVSASLIYLVIGLTATISPSLATFFGFIGLIALYMPIFLVLFFFKIGGFKSNFQSSWFNTGILFITALVPIIVVFKSAISL